MVIIMLRNARNVPERIRESINMSIVKNAWNIQRIIIIATKSRAEHIIVSGKSKTGKEKMNVRELGRICIKTS